GQRRRPLENGAVNVVRLGAPVFDGYERIAREGPAEDALVETRRPLGVIRLDFEVADRVYRVGILHRRVRLRRGQLAFQRPLNSFSASTKQAISQPVSTPIW